jgi:hypothetical protein
MACGGEFNRPLCGVFAQSSLLTHLILSDSFDQELYQGDLPESLLEIKFGDNFNRPLRAEVLPSNLQKLILGADFNQYLNEGSLPNSITHLKFGDNFDQPITHGVLPDNLQELKFGESSQPIFMSGRKY